MGSGYYDATDRYLRRHGHGPTCPKCKKPMFPADDHGRFTCFCNLAGGIDTRTGESFDTPRIPQVNADGMSDAEKAKIDPIHRLNDTPTSAEQEVLTLLVQGKMDTPEYADAQKRLQEERANALKNQ